MGGLVMVGVVASLSVGICVLAVRFGRRPDSSLQELLPLYRLFGLPQSGRPSDWPGSQLRANRDEVRNIANYRTGSRPRA
jgi:hypothetical protein